MRTLIPIHVTEGMKPVITTVPFETFGAVIWDKPGLDLPRPVTLTPGWWECGVVDDKPLLRMMTPEDAAKADELWPDAHNYGVLIPTKEPTSSEKEEADG